MLEFLRSGRLGPIALGMTRQQVESLAGPPDAVGGTSRRRRTPAVWKYGAVELHFAPAGGPLFLILCDDLAALQGGGRLAADAWILSGTLTRARAEAELRGAGITHVVRSSERAAGSDEIVTEAQVHLLFEGEPDTPPEVRSLTSVWLMVPP